MAGLSRSAFVRRKTLGGRADKYAALRAWLRDFASKHHRWGYRRAWRVALREGWSVGRDTVRRLWRLENLRVCPRRARKRVTRGQVPMSVKAGFPGHVWALDFQFDSDWKGRAIKICNVIDEFTREHVGFLVDRSITGGKLVELLDILCLKRGYPAVLRMDNGPEFISKHLETWSKENQVTQAFIPPGQSWNNGYVESFHNRLRDELLNEELFNNHDHASKALQAWSYRYNHYHPHSALGSMTPTEYAENWTKTNQTKTPTTTSPKN